MLTTKIIGTRITEARKKTGISQADLSEQLFISPQAVGKWERGESLPDIITLHRLADILKVDLNYFASGGAPNSTSDTEKVSLIEPTEEKSDKAKRLDWNMSNGNWVDADFSEMNNLHDRLSASNMKNCKFNGSDLSGLLLKSNNIDRCDFSHSKIHDCQFQRSNIANNSFKQAALNGSSFTSSYVYGCDFTGADLTDVSMKNGGFTGTKGKAASPEHNTIADATWKRTSFANSQLADLIIKGTIEDCAFESCSFTRVVFQDCTIKNTFFKHNNLKRVQFINCKVDRLTNEFLKIGKADLSGVEMMA